MAKSVKVKTSSTTFKYTTRPTLKQGSTPKPSSKKKRQNKVWWLNLLYLSLYSKIIYNENNF